MPNSLPINHAPSPRNKYLKYLKVKKKKCFKKKPQNNNQINTFFKAVCPWKVKSIQKLINLCEMGISDYTRKRRKTLRVSMFVEQHIDDCYDEYCNRIQQRMYWWTLAPPSKIVFKDSIFVFLQNWIILKILLFLNWTFYFLFSSLIKIKKKIKIWFSI